MRQFYPFFSKVSSVGTHTFLSQLYMFFADLVIFTIIANASIVALNLSLQFNSVSIYQVAKLLIIPCTCFIEYVHSGIVPSLKALGAIIVVIAGVAIV